MNLFVKMLKAFSGKKANEVYEMDEATAQEWVEAGICEQVEAPVDTLAQVKKSVAELRQSIVKEITEGLKVESRIPATPKAEEEKTFGEFLSLVGKTASKDHRTKEAAHNTLENKYGKSLTQSGGSPAGVEGGYMVPQQWATELFQVSGYESVAFPNRVRVIPMAGEKINIPCLDQTGSPTAGSSAFYGGVAIGVVSEGSAPSGETTPAFKQVSLTAKKLLAYTEVTKELLENSPISVEGIVKPLFVNAVTSWVDYGIFNGGGGTTALTGIIDHAATIKVARASATDVQLADLAKMWARLPASSKKNAAWFYNPTVEAKFPLLGNTNHLVWVNNGVNEAPDLRFLGLPMIPCESLPTIGTAGDVVLADLRYYAVGLNKDVVVDASEHYSFTSDKVVYRCAVRLDGIPTITAPIYLQNGTDTVSPFVQLDDPAS